MSKNIAHLYRRPLTGDDLLKACHWAIRSLAAQAKAVDALEPMCDLPDAPPVMRGLYRQNEWGQPFNDWAMKNPDEAECGTVCCLHGAAVICALDGDLIDSDSIYEGDGPGMMDYRDVPLAAKFLFSGRTTPDFVIKTIEFERTNPTDQQVAEYIIENTGSDNYNTSEITGAMGWSHRRYAAIDWVGLYVKRREVTRGTTAIIGLQELVGIAETREQAEKGWHAMTDDQKARTLRAYEAAR